MKSIILVLFSLLLSAQSYAHEGHDKTPGSVTAPHGGVVKGTDSMYWEIVNETGGFKLYPLTHDVAPISASEITLTGTATFPKKKKSEPVTFSSESNLFSAQVDVKGAYRYTLNLSYTYKGKKEKIKFQIEPQN